MKCPYCDSNIADNSIRCEYCQKIIRTADLPQPNQPPLPNQQQLQNQPPFPNQQQLQNQPPPLSNPQQLQNQPPLPNQQPLQNQGTFVSGPLKNDDYLTDGEKIRIWLGVFISAGLAALIIGIYYYKIKDTKPNKAAALNRHSWMAFFCAVLLFWGGPILLNILDGMSGGNSAAVSAPSNISFEQYVQELRNSNESPDIQITSDNNSHRVYITQKIENSASEIDTTAIKKEIVKGFTGNPDNRHEIEVIKNINAVMVYRFVTSDGVNVDVSIYPSEW